MGNLTPRETEKACRIFRYLNRNNTEQTAITFDGQKLPTDLEFFCLYQPDEIFEEYIATLYDNGRNFYRRRRILGKDWKILTWFFGPMEDRLYRYNWRRLKDTTSEYRKRYAAYLNKSFRYRSPSGRLRSARESYYNAVRLEELLTPDEWRELQILRKGADHEPPPSYDLIDHEEEVTEEDLEAIPPHVVKYLLSVGHKSFERHRGIG